MEVLEGFVLPSTLASVVGGGAGNELLLREFQESTGSDLVLSLHASGGSESPA